MRPYHLPSAAVLTLAYLGCSEPDAPEPARQAPVPISMDYTLYGDIAPGNSVTVQAQLPVSRRGIDVRLVVGTSGEGTDGGPCPPVLRGDCVDVLAPDLVLGPYETNASGRAQFSFIVPANATDTLWAQAVVVRPSNALLGQVSSWTADPPSCDDPQHTCGCLDAEAGNFDPNATLDDGSCTYYGNAASNSFYQGTWGGQILSGDPDWGNRYGTTGVGWNAFDADAILDVLEATNQNLYVSGLGQPVYDPNQVDWSNAAAMAQRIEDRGLDIDYMLCGRDDEDVSGYIDAVLGTRLIRQLSPRVIGYTIDDTNEVFALPTNDLDAVHVTQSEALAIQAAAHSTTEPGEPVSFIPYVPGEGVGMLVADDGIVLGARACNAATNVCPDAQGSDLTGDAFYIFSGDVLEVTGTFDPGDITPGVPHTLSFLMTDHLGYLTQYSMDVVVEINGQEVGRSPMVDTVDLGNLVEGPRIFEMTVDTLTPHSVHDIRLFIDTSGPNITRYQDRIAYLWDAQLVGPDGTPTRLQLDNLEGRVARGTAGSNHTTAPLIADTNAPWRVREAMDGMMFKYPSRDYFYDPVTHERFVASTCRDFTSQGQPCIEVFWGNDQRTGDVVGIPGGAPLVPYFHASQDHATGILVWMPALNLFDRSLGILAPRDPVTADFQVAAGFPGQTPSIPGWNHSWQAVIPSDGVYQVRLKEHGNILAGVFDHRVWLDDVQVIDESSENPSGGVPERSFLVDAQAGQTLTVSVRMNRGVGYGLYLAEYDLRDPLGVSLTLGEHHSGYSEETEFMYACYTEYFSSTSHAEACGL